MSGEKKKHTTIQDSQRKQKKKKERKRAREDFPLSYRNSTGTRALRSQAKNHQYPTTKLKQFKRKRLREVLAVS
jgi:hypothetical protein